MPTLAAMAYKTSIGQPIIYPRNDLNFSENFLHMMFAGGWRSFLVLLFVVCESVLMEGGAGVCVHHCRCVYFKLSFPCFLPCPARL
jgi:hypothetical protein